MTFYRLLENTEWMTPQHPNKLERSSWQFDSESLSRFSKCQNELLIGVSICILLWFCFRSLALSVWNGGTTMLFASYESWPCADSDQLLVLLWRHREDTAGLSVQRSVSRSNPTASSPRWAARFRLAAQTHFQASAELRSAQISTELYWLLRLKLYSRDDILS